MVTRDKQRRARAWGRVQIDCLKALNRKGWTFRQLSEEVGRSCGAVTRYFNESAVPSDEMREQICEALGVENG